MGEVASAVPLLKELRATFAEAPLYLSVSTVAGRKAAERQAGAMVNGLFYVPFDFASCVRKTLSVLRPALVIVLETEIWPNLYYETKRCGARLVVVNGRISNRTWPQYEAWRWFFHGVLQGPDLILVQSETDAKRYERLGAPAERVVVGGNLKYDAAYAAAPVMIPRFGAEKIWIAASTVGPNESGSIRRHFVDEDDLVLDAFAELVKDFPKLLLILAPRQPARFGVVADKLRDRGFEFTRRSAMAEVLSLPGVILLDTIGELAGLYPLADVVFVGGSIAPRGGHNILEPAAAAAPIVTGRYMHNFESIAREFVAAKAMVQVQSGAELPKAIHEILLHRQVGVEMGNRARALVDKGQGVSKAVAKRVEPLYYSACIRKPTGPIVTWLLTVLSRIWKVGGQIKRSQSEQRAASLRPVPVPVVSVGGITIGGAGKTPFANYLAALLRRRGWSPGILTRGYRRRYPAEQLILPRGACISSFLTGDEAQIFLRTGYATVGIGSQRYETAGMLLRQFPETDVLLLDDGFQHARMPRDMDIVLIDGLDPFGQEELVPLGRLREPLNSLERAGIFIVTRASNDGRFAAIKRRLRDYNADAPVFRTILQPRGWHDYHRGAVTPKVAGKRVGAFCGLGSPQNFWDTLESLGANVVFRWTFPDHHTYKPLELTRLAQQAYAHGAELLVTTEKDRINCPGRIDSLIEPLSLAWLEIDLQLEGEERFVSVLENRLRR